MPYINIQIVEDENTTEKKQALIRGATQLMVDVLGRRPEGTYVVIQEIPAEDWGIGYQSIAERRAAAAAAAKENNQ